MRATAAVLVSALLAAGLVFTALFVPDAAASAPALILAAAVLVAGALVAAGLGWWHRRRRRGLNRADAATSGEPHALLSFDLPVTAAAALPGIEPNSLGRYRIERELGRGAMGAVYLGHDPRIGRPVAIKTLALSQEFEGEALVEARTRFFREARMAGRLRHADIVTIFDAGEDRNLAYIAMEFLAGHSLQGHAQPGQLLPVAQVLHIAARVALALAHAHSQGVVHRDIKPANVMVDAASGAVKVTDFGIARVTDASRTRTGMVLGTPAYMAPEQMAGGVADGRADLYSLGVMLFQLLTGRLPHEAPSLAALMRQIANEPAPDVRSLRPELPESLANVVALALEKRPALRYADGQALADDLRAVAAMLPRADTAPPPGTGASTPL